MSRRLLFFIVFLSGCASLPPVPEHTQYGIYPKVDPPGFYGVDNVTKEKKYRAFMDPEMAGGQCLTPADYKSWSDWLQQVEEIAQRRCN